MEIIWETTKEDALLIAEIGVRATAMAAQLDRTYDPLAAIMDVTACHANGCPLDLQALLDSEPYDFVHDVFGIRAHIDRDTGRMGGCFLPRFAIRE